MTRVLGLDLGLTKDRSVLCDIAADLDTRRVRVIGFETWTPPPGGRVDLQQVEEATGRRALEIRAPVVLDPWQAALMAQRLRAQRIQVVEHPFTPDTRRKLFGTLLDLIRTRRLTSPPHEELRRELLGLEVQETTSGWRVDHRVGRHDDHVVALALAAHHALEKPRREFQIL